MMQRENKRMDRKRTTYRNLIILFFSLLLLFVLINWFVWKNYTEALLSSKYEGGDLARLAYLNEFRQARQTKNTLSRRFVQFDRADTSPVDMITIGDSFSMGRGGGLNTYYQDYIASYNNFKVLALPTYNTDDLVAYSSPLSSIMVLYNSGFLDIYKPKYILLQSVERYTVERMSKPIEKILYHNDKIDNVLHYFSAVEVKPDTPPHLPFVNMGNAKFVFSELMYMLTGKVNRRVRLFKLDRPLFSVLDGKQLLVFPDEIENTAGITKEQLVLMNRNLNYVARLLKEKGIRLYFMPVVNKYNLYYDHIVERERKILPRSIFFEELSKLPKEYGYIDTKAILSVEIQKGVYDIFYPDDTHWSWKASEAIFSNTKFVKQ